MVVILAGIRGAFAVFFIIQAFVTPVWIYVHPRTEKTISADGPWIKLSQEQQLDRLPVLGKVILDGYRQSNNSAGSTSTFTVSQQEWDVITEELNIQESALAQFHIQYKDRVFDIRATESLVMPSIGFERP